MVFSLNILTSLVVFSPLLGGMIAGLFAKRIGRIGAHSVTIFGLAVAFCAALFLACQVIFDHQVEHLTLYTWLASGSLTLHIGFLVDPLTALMMVVVTFVSFLVHIYSMGYMADDAGYQRFFCYVSLFTFCMLILITADNFLQLFFGWEGVGLISYLLIGFWFTRPAAAAGSLKAFLVNRVGDFGFLIGIACLFAYTGTLDYAPFFNSIASLKGQMIGLPGGFTQPVLEVIALCLLIGAMGKSAQIPLHVWLPESMEGPTPISALIHAATMVTAGVYMVARLSPLYEWTPGTENIMLIIGASGALWLGLVGVVQNDIKRIVAYSTLSQLGYMMAANAASAYSAAIFHLLTHACFKALLFLAAGSVIVALHHEQDIRRMGSLWKYMPITAWTFFIGALSLTAIPPFSGFYSKDAIINAVSVSTLPSAPYATFCLVLGAFVTGAYIFRGFFVAFVAKPEQAYAHPPKESPWSITLPLIALAIPSVVLGYFLAPHMLSTSNTGWLHSSIWTNAQHLSLLAPIYAVYHTPATLYFDLFKEVPFWLATSSVIVMWYIYTKKPGISDYIKNKMGIFYRILIEKLGFDWFYEQVIVRCVLALSAVLYRIGDQRCIDDGVIKGGVWTIHGLAAQIRKIQTGKIYHYLFVLIFSLLCFVIYFIGMPIAQPLFHISL
jgi:NADH-quinone oxidoreductase subunit L